GGPWKAAETYAPRPGTFAATSPMSLPRQTPNAILLAGGGVLVAGGSGIPPPGEFDPEVTASADIYDPATRSFAPAANDMSSRRSLAFIAPLGDGRVVICGGFEQFFGTPGETCDPFDPASRTFSPASAPPIARGD